MKNKKGISIGRILLYVLFLFLIVLFVYTLFITFKSMKKKEPSVTESVNSSLRFAYNNNYQYSAADYINSTYLNFYNSTESIAISVYLGTIPVNNVNGVYTNFDSISGKDFLTVMSPFSSYPSSSLVPYSVSSSFDNSYSISNAMKELYSQAVNAAYEDYYGGEEVYNYFTDFRSNGNLFASAALVINCDIPVSMFDFNLTGVTIGSGKVGYFYVSPFTSNYGSTYMCSIDSSNRFEHTSLPSGFLANYTNIKRIIIPVYQSYRSVEDNFYIINNSFNYDYQSVISSTSFNVSFDFDIFTRSNAYQDGYNNGYADGVVAADAGLRDENSALTNQINSLSSTISSLNSQIEERNRVISTLQAEIDSFNSGQFTLKNFFFTFADTPFRTVHNVLNFDFFGVNLFRFFVGVITSLGMIWLIKKFI